MVITSGNYILRLAGFSILLLIVDVVSQKYFPSAFNYSSTHVLIAWYFILTAAVHFLIMKSGRKDEKGFIRAFMTTMTVRFMLHMAIVFFWAFTHRETAIAFIISYFILYLCYTLFEILMLMKIVRIHAIENKQPPG